MVNKGEAIDSFHNDTIDNYRAAHKRGEDMNRRQHTLYTGITAVGISITVILVVLILVQNRSISSQGQRNGEATVNYLDCIGHIQKPVAQRTQADYDKCLDAMRATVRGKR